MPLVDREAQCEQRRLEIAHLKNNLNINRMKLSRTITELINYCDQHAQADPLLYPRRDNPFKEKKTCEVL